LFGGVRGVAYEGLYEELANPFIAGAGVGAQTTLWDFWRVGAAASCTTEPYEAAGKPDCQLSFQMGGLFWAIAATSFLHFTARPIACSKGYDRLHTALSQTHGLARQVVQASPEATEILAVAEVFTRALDGSQLLDVAWRDRLAP
jgi:hypothetical protein